ncbi:guanylyl cyclase-activating protein 3 [Protobothrops mucrosquamatus]|uniref:guanylyl cyclase-activating protein 3 n=1 Tax=Protobothrops mucrosquamatus TaxID=103944 RepID=UPI00077599E3|nr:guanylyl cyclase-activating protein 3 [Protobothrops mucrosquamatus]
MGANESMEEMMAMENYQWYAKFMKECPSGQLTMYECKNILGLENSTTLANNYVEKVFNIFDTNKDGFIDYLELLAAINLVIRGKIDQKLKWYFKLYDIDGSGTIDKKEVISILMAIQTINNNQDMTPEELTNLIFQKIDVNNDGELTLEEFMNGVEKDEHFQKIISKSFELSNVLKIIQSERRHSI